MTQSPETPSVSVCIPTRNDAKVIGDALRSAMSQAYARLEILVLDNDSTDATAQMIAEIAGGDPRVRYFRHTRNIGMAANFSACIDQSQGEFVMVLCSDDALEANCVEALANELHAHPGAAFAACSRVITDVALEKVSTAWLPDLRNPIDREQLARRCFARGNVIGEPSAVLFRREAARRGFDGRFSQCLDLEMWLHLLGKGTAVFERQPLCRIRRHSGQATMANIKSGRVVEDKQLLFRNYLPLVGSSLTVFDKLSWDGRMASSLTRSRLQGNPLDPSAVHEIFYRQVYLHLFIPSMSVLWFLLSVFARKLSIAEGGSRE